MVLPEPVTTEVPQTEPMPIAIPKEPVPDQAIVRFQPGTTAADMDAYIAQVTAQGGVISQRIDALGVIVIEGVNEAQLPASAAVAASEPDYFAGALMAVPLSDPYYPQQWSLPVINAPQGWLKMPTDAPKVTVDVIDSGMCADHPDLAGRVLPGWDFVEEEVDPNDTLGHGCGVAGIIAANVDDGRYSLLIGISFAAPEVAGVVAVELAFGRTLIINGEIVGIKQYIAAIWLSVLSSRSTSRTT
ncbi:MAG: S8 family serine peptidase [Anaerolineae bacterium]|nr:S8 family serine peptidase [Anaerolineae bacterium]